MTETPRERFQESDTDVSFMAQLSESRAFIRALDFAMLQMQAGFPAPQEIEIANQYYQQLCGARLFRRILLELHVKPSVLPSLKNDNLRPDVPKPKEEKK